MADVWAGITPRRWQTEAFEAVLRALRRGMRRPLVHACTGSGKSRVVGALAAACTGSVLVTTPTQALVDQLATTIEQHVGWGRVGRCYQHAWELDRDVVVACIPSLPAVLAQRAAWSCWLADEAHRLEGLRTREVVDQLKARVAIGFTATPFRGDDRGLVVWDDIVYSYTSHDAVSEQVLVPWRVVRSSTSEDVDVLTRRWVAEAEGPGIVSAISIADANQVAERLGALSIHGYLPRDEQQRRLRTLQVGEIPCLVHVQLLTEGVDLPWLRWLVLRRPVRSPVRLVQEVGRVLRSAPGKTEAVLYDPHDCIGEVGLVHGASLEDAQRAGRAKATDPEDAWSIPELEGLAELAELPKSKAISVLAGWATDALGALRGAGVARPPSGTVNPDGPWRHKRASEKQRLAAQKAVAAIRYLPTDAHRAAVELLLAEDRLRSGTASDLLELLWAIGRARGTRGVVLPDVRAAEVA
ncbi:MAG: DEAD/DEAH box helicase family protein [Myxococcota bacterium]